MGKAQLGLVPPYMGGKKKCSRESNLFSPKATLRFTFKPLGMFG